jgi:5-methylcytosine-specific restriction endonuclease McrA
LTSHPTSRNAQVSTRAWLLDEYGPHCAYCGTRHSARVMTLDHVAPRRGQIAYDRRDNLVLACRACNALKRDMPPLAFLLSVRSRAVNLVRYGKHLSAGLLEMARPLVKSITIQESRVVYGPAEDDEESPYKE